MFLAVSSSCAADDLQSRVFSSTPKDKTEISSIQVWANSGEDKVTRDELRAIQGAPKVVNSVWNGQEITLFAARNETVAFNVVLESLQGTSDVSVKFAPFDKLKPELFYVRYLPIKGISKLAFDHYDERHVPQRFRRPHDSRSGQATGGWQDRPDHDKEYPDIAVPLSLHPKFDIAANTNQSIWCDVYVPQDLAAGIYTGELVVYSGEKEIRRIAVELEVLDFSLPAEPTARPFLYLSTGNINRRYLGEAFPHDFPTNLELNSRSRKIIDQHFQLAKQHGIALITEHVPIDLLENSGWIDRLSGALFTSDRGYQGRGQGIGNGVFSVGTYGEWKNYWQGSETSREKLQAACDAYVKWFKQQDFSTSTDVFLYLIDESDKFPWMEEKAQWVAKTMLPTLATLRAPHAVTQVPNLTICCSPVTIGMTAPWAEAVEELQTDPTRRFWMYNAYRPASGTLTTEDDGIALRELAWGQFKFRVERWFVWEGSYYNNFQGGTGETNVFKSAHVFGGIGGKDDVFGETGWNYQNGDGVLFYPGTDTVFPAESYGVDYPLASLRLKHWRRGIQDHDYLTLAAAIDPKGTEAIVDRMVPRVLWEIGVDNPDDPTYVTCDISWSTDPDQWEAARRELASIIEQSPASH